MNLQRTCVKCIPLMEQQYIKSNEYMHKYKKMYTCIYRNTETRHIGKYLSRDAAIWSNGNTPLSRNSLKHFHHNIN